MKLGCLQLDSRIGQVEDNIKKADNLLATSTSVHGLDLLILPELAFTGYNFPSAEAIKPYLEPTTAGISTIWAKKTALHLGCHIIVGYPELSEDLDEHGTPQAYNSTVTVGPDGSILATYRKSHLYYTDDIWANEGSGFFCGEVGTLGIISHGICMDINPYQFQAPEEAYEFANHGVNGKAALVVLSTAWLTHLTQDDLELSPDEPDLDTISYWVSRMAPLTKLTDGKPVTVVFANRCGTEKNDNHAITTKRGQVIDFGESVSYAGSSCVMRFLGDQISIFNVLGAGEEGLLVVDTSEPPRFQLSRRPRLDAEPKSQKIAGGKGDHTNSHAE